jgi:hypothetical protein
MPYKDSIKQKEYFKQQQDKKWIKKYIPIFQEMEKYDTPSKIIYLSKIHGSTRLKIYKNFNISHTDQIEKEIRKIQNSRYHFKQKLNIKKRIDNNWEFVKKWMTDRGCDCEEKNITKLSFHHLDPLKKENTIRKMCNYSMKRILVELKKGVVKCKNCHTIIHAGTSKEREKSLINQYFKKTTNRNLKYRRKNKLLIWEYKKTLSCIKCGVNKTTILLFHHIDSDLKNEKISLLFKTSRGVINKELSKTTCLCHNCHEDFHYIYGRKNNNQQQLEQYIGKKITPNQIDINDYLPLIDKKISQFHNLSFSTT